MALMKFSKMHGLGNDYVFINTLGEGGETVDDPATLARAVSDRHTGIGSDGLILVGGSSCADVRMEMYNADGSRAQMCGNGIRCVAKYAYERHLVQEAALSIETDAGLRSATCVMDHGRVSSVCVDMGPPAFSPSSLPVTVDAERLVDWPIEIEGQPFLMTCVSMGNPHAVIFVDDLAEVDLASVGRRIEHAPVFPERVNVHFVHVQTRSEVSMITWERGSGATRACGSGACAVCVAGAVANRSERRVKVSLPGGELEIHWADDDHVYMTGPAVEVYTGEWLSC